MNKIDIENELKRLEKNLNQLKSSMENDNNKELIPVIGQLEEKAANLRKELYRNLSPKEKLQIARHPNRPTTYDYINLFIKDFIELHGDRLYADDLGLVAGLGFFQDKPVTVIGHQKGKDTKENIKRHFGMAHPEGYRKALRLMRQAEKYQRPVICLIDTPGAYPGIGAEERGQAEAIAVNLREMSGLKTIIISIVNGEGGSGGALGIGVADKVFLLSNSYYSVISPEGCAAILWRDSTKAGEAAVALKISGNELLKLGLIDGVIEEPYGGAHTDHKAMAASIENAIAESLDELTRLDTEELLERRYQKYRRMGVFKE